MKSIELYEKAMQLKPGPVAPKTLSDRTLYVLLRTGFNKPGTSTLDIEKVQQAVLNGTIWKVRDIGPYRVREICNWLGDD